ncbi:response regulator transcription factor [Rothia uropygialis]|uniref:response regulator transcription factor n=1 Tax=Kocuria sp. 36 TaxID=1415402 RepID=UPI00101CB56A|nr:response regulator transcription factor [Kocuria sp. 36]
MIQPLRIFLVDDQTVVRSGFSLVLSVEPGIEVVGEAANAQSALERLREQPVDVVLMDIQMPGMSGLTATRYVVQEGLGKVIMLTTFDRSDYLFGALEAGASGFLLKTASAEELVTAIEAVAGGQALLSPEVTLPLIQRIVDESSGSGAGYDPPAEEAARRTLCPEDLLAFEALSQREKEVLILMAQGKSNTEIADDLFLGLATVKTHVSRIFAKTRSRDRVQAVIFAYRTGLAQPS